MEVVDDGYIISIRVQLKNEFKNDKWYVEQIAEQIKDYIYDCDEDISPVKDVTYNVILFYKAKEVDSEEKEETQESAEN